MTRVPHTTPDLEGPAATTNVFRALANSPQMVRGVGDLGARLLLKGSLPPRTRELVVLRIGAVLHCDYEWGQHAVVARELGVGDDELRAVRSGDFEAFSAAEAAAIAYGEAVERVAVDDDVFAAAAGHYDHAQLVELTVLGAYYGLVCRVLLGLAVDLDEGLVGLDSP